MPPLLPSARPVRDAPQSRIDGRAWLLEPWSQRWLASPPWRA